MISLDKSPPSWPFKKMMQKRPWIFICRYLTTPALLTWSAGERVLQEQKGQSCTPLSGWMASYLCVAIAHRFMNGALRQQYLTMSNVKTKPNWSSYSQHSQKTDKSWCPWIIMASVKSLDLWKIDLGCHGSWIYSSSVSQLRVVLYNLCLEKEDYV